MAEFNTYPIFVADQVLTATHLNEIVNYLEEQDRLTRNKLIGIGIVCGLEIKASTEQIRISKGCGVTSEGYLIVQDQATFTHYRSYDLPEYFSPEYRAIYENWNKFELLTTEKSFDYDDAIFIKNSSGFMDDKVVVLLLEMTEKPLKNCIDTDCDDKGEKVEFKVKPLLIEKNDLDDFIESHEVKEEDEEPVPTVPVKLHHLHLKRFNVPLQELSNTNDVFDAFLRLVDEKTLKQLAGNLNYCYFHYKPILSEESNPFGSVFEYFKEILEKIKSSNPFFIQYYYDWINDLIKAFNEFRGRIFYLDSMCCPNEGLFPLHLMLGEADKDTGIDFRSKYRNYFIYSPLFNDQADLLREVRMLFKRLVALVKKYNVPDYKSLYGASIKITPSVYLEKALSQRCIPYYYDALETYPLWSWMKTRQGYAKFNLSYNAEEYSSADIVINPLEYDIEPFNFFRIEGHIGKTFTSALTTVISHRDQYNLPFDVKALSTASISKFFESKDYQCQFSDLDSLYNVLLAELQCKLGDFECMAAKIPYQLSLQKLVEFDDLTIGNLGQGRAIVNENIRKTVFSNLQFNRNLFSLLKLNFESIQLPDYSRGDFMKSHCNVEKGSVGEVYLSAVAKGTSFTRPSQYTGENSVLATITTLNSMYLVYAYLFYFIDSVENTFAVSVNKSLDDFDSDVFKARYQALMDVVDELATLGEYLEQLDPDNDQYSELLKKLKDIGFYEFVVRVHSLLHACLDESLAALKEEYEQRRQDLQLLTNFMNYFEKCPGMEHKAGVPKGGTFIMVYHESTPSRLSTNFKFTRNLMENLPGALSAGLIKDKDLANISALVSTSYVSDPQLLGNFQLALGKFLDSCNDMDDATREKITGILVSIPESDEPLKFRVPEQTVIADFYLPYICCSDCPPVTYVLPVKKEELSIDISPSEFCNDDDKIYTVDVSPEGGELTASNGGGESETFEFSPKDVVAGTNTLTYTLPDGRNVSIDVEITESFEVSIGFEVQEDGQTVQFFPGGIPTDGEVTWDFGDGSTPSTEHNPTHTYSFDEEQKSFEVVLTVSDGPCTAASKQTITLNKPPPSEFDIIPKIFCNKDKKEYDFKISPFPARLTEITNEDKLVMKLDKENEKLFFIPAKTEIKATKDFHFEYAVIGLDIRIVVPDASFFMNIVQNGEDFTLSLWAKQTDATEYLWKVVQGDVNHTFDEQKIELSLMQFKLNPGQTINIGLSLNYQLVQGNCSNRKPFSLTEAIFFNHVGKGEFDNNTKE